MLVVITIIGLIMALVGPRVLNYLSESKVKAAKIQIESFSAALDLFYLDNGRYPGRERRPGRAGAAPASAPTPGTAPISRPASVPDDPWGHPYVYKVPGDHAALRDRLIDRRSREGGGTSATPDHKLGAIV